ncbi:hypothetical protein [Haliovirga abyssi]|uniref:Uncharacterized protein n=1 Tax=Haliovirga abyssi TaxID=2996794 RepID=A0AAU9DGD5_9FUSO|nr:hypothetical protein [Haliovirga abyssi]BDU51542.1 hypothetical protein HLVA_21110 [Haliovirga abyssi]
MLYNIKKRENIEELCKLTGKEDITKNDWSLTYSTYVGITSKIADEDFNFEELRI